MGRKGLLRAAGVLLTLTFAFVGADAALAATVQPQVTGLKAGAQTWTAKTVGVSWARQSGASGYTVKWATNRRFQGATYGQTTTNSYAVPTSTPGTAYYVVAAARNAAGIGKWSTPITVKLDAHSVGTFGTISIAPVQNGVRVTFPAVSNASDYRVRWSAGPNENREPDRWREHYSAWFSAFRSDKTLTYTVPTSAGDLTAVAYGNPIFVRVQARNTFFSTTYVRKSAQVHALPSPATPGPGTALHVASWNVLCSTCEPSGAPNWGSRAPAIASVVNAVDPDVLAVMEANGPSGVSGTPQAYLDLERRFNDLRLTDAGSAPAGRTEPGTRIYYDAAKFSVNRIGHLSGIKDYRTYPEAAAPDTSIPWAELARRDDPSARVIVVAAHYGIPSSSYAVGKKAMLGRNSGQVLAALDSSGLSATGLPIVFAGDLNDHRYPEDETDGAQATLVRGGFYDSSASLRRSGTAKSTYNNYQAPSRQVDDANQDGLRIDYILTRGIVGSTSFTNRWDPGTAVIPSDHNMIDAVVTLPTTR